MAGAAISLDSMVMAAMALAEESFARELSRRLLALRSVKTLLKAETALVETASERQE